MPGYYEALLEEMKRFFPQKRLITSVYFGGGTPSYFPVELLIKLRHFIKEHFLITTMTETTIEVNPATITVDDLILLRQAGFNRLSIGLQAVQDVLLQVIGRIHSWQDFLTVYQQSQKIGFKNIGVDLIFGLPEQGLKEWRETLVQVVGLQPQHISAYGLQLETGTRLAEMVSAGSLALPTEDMTTAMMRLAMDYLRESGYEHYEISNYAKPGFCSVHNLGYWTGRDYLGFGAGATSTFQQERWENIKDPLQYIQTIKNSDSAVAGRESITNSILLTEAVMLGLRMRSGINLVQFKNDFNLDLIAKTATELEKFLAHGLVKIKDGNLALTDEGVLISNYIISSLLGSL